MASMDQLVGVKAFVPRPPSKKQKLDGTPAAPKRIGKVHNVVFSPDGRKVVGLMIKRPDVAGVKKRDDLFVALDSFSFCENGILVEGEAATDKDAIKRLGIDFDRCIIWGGMDVVTRSGKTLGYVTDVTFDLPGGDVDTFYVTDGAVAASLVGSVPVPADMVLGYAHDNMVVKDDAEGLKLTGGVAAKAGEGFAKAKETGKAAAEEAGKAASHAVDKGSFALGKAIGHARNAVKEAMTEDPEVPELPAQDVVVETVETKPAATSDGDSEPVTYKPAPKTEARPEEKTGAQDKVDKAAYAVGKKLGATKGMFSSFLKEFEENSK